MSTKEQHIASPAEVRALAQEAYIYGFPLVDNYRILYSYFVDRTGPEYKAPWNQINNTAHVYTPDDQAVQAPNSDTPCSQLGADLRAEPLVISVPNVEKGRYYCAQFIDLYTFNFAYVGTRATGNDAESFLLAGPRWAGDKPPGIHEVIRADTKFAFVLFRTQLFGADDIENVKKVQAGYKVQTLSGFLREDPPTAQPKIHFVKPLSAERQRTSLEFFNILNFLLEFCPTQPSERALRARLGRFGIGAGRKLRFKYLPPEIRAAFREGMADAWRAQAEITKQIATGAVAPGQLFGTREHLKNNYLYRMAGAVNGIYGNSSEEAVYHTYRVDSTGAELDGTHRYLLRFRPGQLPPVKAFWSVTLYELPAQLLSANSRNRYLISSTMLPELKRDADGGLTIYVQHESPGNELESNWLPAPAGPLTLALRLYWPKPEVADGKWTVPLLEQQH